MNRLHQAVAQRKRDQEIMTTKESKACDCDFISEFYDLFFFLWGNGGGIHFYTSNNFL